MQCERHPWITLQGQHFGRMYCPECDREDAVTANARNVSEAMELLLETQRQLEHNQREEASRVEEQRKYQEELSFLREGLVEFDEPFQDTWALVNNETKRMQAELSTLQTQNTNLSKKYNDVMEYLEDRFLLLAEEAKLDDCLDSTAEIPGDKEKVVELSTTCKYVDSSIVYPLSRIASSLAFITRNSSGLLGGIEMPSAAGFILPGIVLLCLGGFCACVGAHGPLPEAFPVLGMGCLLVYFALLIGRATKQYRRHRLVSEYSRYICMVNNALGFDEKPLSNPQSGANQLLIQMCWSLSEPFAEALMRSGDSRVQEYFELKAKMSEQISLSTKLQLDATQLIEKYEYMRQEISEVGKAIIEGRRVKGKTIRLRKCPSCAGPFSSEDRSCPYCGSSFG
jgi:hypothetical protein